MSDTQRMTTTAAEDNPSRITDRGLDLARFWLVYTACLGLLLFRGWDRITHPELFAEGVRFMGGVLNNGWMDLFQTYDFFFHTAPKLVALVVVNLVPLADVPFYTNLACYAVTATAMASIVRSGYRWMIPSDAARIALALLMPLAPGLMEVLGNLAGLHWSLLVWLGILTLKDPKHPLTAWELLIVVLIVFSSVGAVVFLPIVFLRLLFAWNRSSAPPVTPLSGLPRRAGEAVLFSVLFLLTAYLLADFIFSAERVGGDSSLDIVAAARGIDDLLPHLVALFTTFYFLHPFLGTHNTSLFLEAMPFYPLFLVALTVVVLLLWRASRALDYRFWLIPAWLLSFFLLAVMLSIVRYWSFYGLFSYPYPDWWFRYNFLYGTSGLVFWFMLLRPRSLFRIGRWPTVVTIALIIGYVSQAQTRTVGATPPHDQDAFFIERYEKKRYWSRTADDLKSSMETGCPPEVEVRGSPGGKWRFVYKSPKSSQDCDES